VVLGLGEAEGGLGGARGVLCPGEAEEVGLAGAWGFLGPGEAEEVAGLVECHFVPSLVCLQVMFRVPILY